MTFADVLLRVVPGAHEELGRLSVAVDLAQRLHARLDGIFVDGANGEDAEWARTLFERAVSKTSLETTWRIADGHSRSALLFQARRSDLAILPPGALVTRPECKEPQLIALASGRPTLILPQPRRALSIGHRILVGWNDTREAARAVNDAMPILVNAERVTVLTVVTGDDPEPLVDRQLMAHLRQHGVPAELARRHGEPAQEIAAMIRESNADILVIGLCSDEREAQKTLGEVARRFVRTTSLPVFLSR